MLYSIGDVVAVRGSAPHWEGLVFDVIIIGTTTIQELEDINISYYDLYFAGKGIDELYDQYYNDNIPIYMAREIERDPFRIIENTDAPKVEFIYFSDELLDLNTTELLRQRTKLYTELCIGRIDTDKVTDEFKDELRTKFIEIIQDYTATGYLVEWTDETIAQPESEAAQEDELFEQLKAQREAEEAAEEAARQQREAELVAREQSVAEREAELDAREDYLDHREEDLNNREAELDDRAHALDNRENLLDSREDTLNAQQLEINNQINILTEQSAILRNAIDLVHQRETELGLPLTDFDIDDLMY